MGITMGEPAGIGPQLCLRALRGPSVFAECGRLCSWPANPALGRIIRDGQYFIGGKPIHETDFRLDPEYPRSASSVRAMIGTSGSLPVQVCGLHGPLPSEGIIIGDAQSADDLRCVLTLKPGSYAWSKEM